MLAVVCCYLLVATIAALCAWAILAAREHARRAAEEARAEFVRDAGNMLARMADAKEIDGDHVTAAALRSVGAYIVADIYDVPTEALRNETRLKAREKKEDLWATHSQ